jgi:hypothetical protein
MGKRDLTPSVPPKTSPGAQNMKKGHVAPGSAENKFGRAKHESGTPRKWDPPKMNLGAQNMKTGPDALGTAENESGRAKHENGTRRPRYRRK